MGLIMNRRALFGFLGISPVAAVGAVMAAQRTTSDGPANGVPAVSFLWENTKVEMSPGRDGGLWIRDPKTEKWSRVVTA